MKEVILSNQKGEHVRVPISDDFIIGVDPGPETSGLVIYVPQAPRIAFSNYAFPNDRFPYVIRCFQNCSWAVEMVSCYGMPVGDPIFNTCVAIGAIEERARDYQSKIYRITRPDAKVFLCGSRAAKGTNLTQALKDRFPKVGGGKDASVGIKKQPGPLFGIAKHSWAALAVAYTLAHGEAHLGMKEWALGRTV